MYIIRYSEIGLKGPKERSMMERLLKENIKACYSFAGINPNVWADHGHIYTDAESDQPLRYIMGIKSFSRCEHFKLDGIEGIGEYIDRHYRQKIIGKKFAVKCHRIGNQSFSSMDVQRYIGDMLYDDSGGVDLDNPDVRIVIEIRNDDVYVYDTVTEGPGGLPLGSQGRMVSLVSGGIDSPVATYMMMKRGSPCDIVFCSLSDPVDTSSFLKIASSFVQKWAPYRNDKIFIVDCRPLIKMLTSNKNIKFSNVTYKRILYTIAAHIARVRNANGIVTGESLGQVSSQTAENLRAIESGIDIPVYRPLIGFDKDEIVKVARSIGTYPEENLGEFCSLFAEHPITRSRPEQIDGDMEYIDLSPIIDNMRILSFRDISGSILNDDIRYDGNAENAVFIDLRPEKEYEKSHIEGAVHMGIGDIEKISDKGRSYVFYCEKGMQSAYAASLLKSHGFRACYDTYQNLLKGEKFKVKGI